jgi:hypothetical protein
MRRDRSKIVNVVDVKSPWAFSRQTQGKKAFGVKPFYGTDEPIGNLPFGIFVPNFNRPVIRVPHGSIDHADLGWQGWCHWFRCGHAVDSL